MPVSVQLAVEDNHQDERQKESCSALQSLANAAERQLQQSSNNNSSNNNNNSSSNASLHQQLLLLNAAEYYQQQHAKASPTNEASFIDDDMDMDMCVVEPQDKCDETDHELLTLADENAGLPGYQANDSYEDAQATPQPATATRDTREPATTSSRSMTKRPIQRRRVRRKAQSTLDDQAEHLTEMSVRGLDLFRYASVVEGVYRCTECAKENMQKTFKNKYSFQRHAFLYHEGKHRKVFPCPVCRKEFSRPDKMKNHLKMTHESFTPPKDMGAFSPLKYLISAAAAGEMQTTLYQQQQQQQHEQFQRHLEEQQLQQQQQQQQQQQLQTQATFECQDSTLLLPDVKQEQQQLDQDQDDLHGYAPSTPTAAADAMLSLQNDVIIKNEIQISPSPSPSPPAATLNLPLAATAAQTAT